MRPTNTKTCAVCGKEFHDPPSSSKITCSRACEIVWRSRISDPSQMKQAQAEMVRREAENPETHHTAKAWVLRSPEGKTYRFVNLKHFVENSGFFDGDKYAYRQIIRMKQTAVGTIRKKPVFSYHGWTLESFGEGNYNARPTKPVKFCPICGNPVTGRNGSAVYCSTECRQKARADRARIA